MLKSPEVTLADVNAFRRTEPGTMLIYHTGILWQDRYRESSALSDARRSMLNHVASEIWRLHERGAVALFQRVVPTIGYDYIAVRTGRGGELVPA